MVKLDLGARTVPNWYAAPELGEGVAIAMLMPRSSEFSAVLAEVTGPRSTIDMAEYIRVVCQRWFLDFRGFVGADGQAVPNTHENRVQMCELYGAIWAFVRGRIGVGLEIEEEKNGDSGSA